MIAFVKLSFFLSGFINTHSAQSMSTWQTEPMVSMTVVTDSVRRISLGAGTADHIKVGSIRIKKITSPQISTPILYFFNIEKFIDELSKKIKSHLRDDHVVPLLQSIGALEKSELAEVAESLIALTSVKRKITFYTESVGGPIDVAIISKHEGFQWIKKK